MCGICGFLGRFDRERIGPMTDALSHRGPDDRGIFVEPSQGIALGHRRLSIIDLAGGSQPIYNEDESVVVVFNGEIYNYIELREELRRKGHIFRTNSDTETIVHLYEEDGDRFPERLNGCFAIALYDRRLRRLYLVRDRLGIRPVYYWRGSDGFIFGSEPKALFASGCVPKELDRESLASFLRLRYVPGPRSLFAGLKKLPPGHFLCVTSPDASPELKCYWNIDETPIAPRSDDDCVEAFDDLLRDAVRLRMRSDVPVSAFLSGGLDSSLVVRLMAEFGTVYRTYSIGFRLPIDENALARSLSSRLGIPHRDIFVEKNGHRDLPRVVGRMDEPVGDVIILPTHTLAEEVSREAKVVMTGEGADEVWAGYLHHFTLHYLNDAARRRPSALLAGSGLASRLPLKALSAIFPYPAELGAKGREKLVKLLAQAQRPREAYLLFATFATSDQAARLLGLARPPALPPVYDRLNDAERSILARILAVERRSWLPDYTLCKQDTLTMANSLEGRVPFLDHRIVEFAASLPDDQKVRMFRAKYLLRKVAAKYVGRETAWRKKKAFYIPTEQVFGDEYERMAEERFTEETIRRHGVFEPEAFREIVSGAGREILDNKLRNNLMIFQMWYERNFWPS